jgi:hypothetical protein
MVSPYATKEIVMAAYVVTHVDDGWSSYYSLVRRSDGVEISNDGGEPEDKMFLRDFRGCVEELNRLANRIAELEGKQE